MMPAELSPDNLALMIVFTALVVATFVTGAWTLIAQRRQGKGADAAPRMLPYLTVANSIVAVIGAYRWWGFALGSLVNMAVTVLLVLLNRKLACPKKETKASGRHRSKSLPNGEEHHLESVLVEITIASKGNGPEYTISDVYVQEGQRELKAKSVVDMLRDHKQKFGGNACNAADPAPFMSAEHGQGRGAITRLYGTESLGSLTLMSPFSPASHRLAPELCRRSKSLDREAFPPVHSVTDDIVDSLMNGAVMEQLLSNARKSGSA
eukprot:jgi/Botrbrau1/18714/Bobra.0386s0039.1